MFAVALPGCRRSPPTDSDSPGPFEGVRIKVFCSSDGSAATVPRAILARYGQPWAKHVGATMTVATDAQSAEDADIVLIRPAALPSWAAAGKLLAVPQEYLEERAAYSWSGLLPVFREKLLVWNHRPYGLPLLGDAPLCFYRADLFRDMQHMELFKKAHADQQLAPPATWADFANIAGYFFQHRDGKKVTPSLPPLPDDDEELDRLFYAAAAAYARQAVQEGQPKQPLDHELFSFHYDMRTGKQRIDQPGFVHTLKMLQRLQRFRPLVQPGKARSSPEAFRDGQAVLCLADASWIAEFRKKLPADAIGVCRVPGGDCYFGFADGRPTATPRGNFVPYLGAGGWLGVVPKKAAHPEAAFALLAELSSREIGRRIVFEPAWGGGGYRLEHFDNASAWYGFGLNAEQTPVLVEALRQTLIHPGLKNPLLRLRIPNERAHLAALIAEVRSALASGSDPAKAMQNVAKRWGKIDRETDAIRRLNDYRLSLSLEPIK
jgi:ABC-type glycerol-3-phosphate transport system substrate-binding protein